MNYSEYSSYLFNCFNTKSFPTEICIPNDGWKDFINLTYDYHKQKCDFKYCENLNEVKFKANNNMIIGYSGGRDSLCSLLKNQETYNVKGIFHCKGLNISYRNETNVVLETARTLNVPCEVYSFKNKGTGFEVENPIKNEVIVGLMADIMANNQISNCSMGMFESDHINTINGFDYYSDYIEPMKLFEKAIQNTFESFKFVYAFNNQAQEVKYFLENHYNKIDLLQSCVLPDRYRDYRAKQNSEKYNINILKNRCGCSCRKCITELIEIAEYNNEKLNPELYKHCIDFLRKDLKKKNPETDFKNTSDEEILQCYFDFKKFKELLGCRESAKILKR